MKILINFGSDGGTIEKDNIGEEGDGQVID
jgi:hypothetical protein